MMRQRSHENSQLRSEGKSRGNAKAKVTVTAAGYGTARVGKTSSSTQIAQASLSSCSSDEEDRLLNLQPVTVKETTELGNQDFFQPLLVGRGLARPQPGGRGHNPALWVRWAGCRGRLLRPQLRASPRGPAGRACGPQLHHGSKATETFTPHRHWK